MKIIMVPVYTLRSDDLLVVLIYLNAMLMYFVIGWYKVNKLLDRVYELLEAYFNA